MTLNESGVKLLKSFMSVLLGAAFVWFICFQLMIHSPTNQNQNIEQKNTKKQPENGK